MADDERKCGDCTVCCTVMGVEELPKAAGTRCPHLGRGCTIYADRPASCAAFQCLWKLGIGKVADRPDRVGVMLSATLPEPGTILATAGVEGVAQAHELREGVLSRPGRAVDLVRSLSMLTPVVILHHDGSRRLVGDPEIVERIDAAMIGWTTEG